MTNMHKSAACLVALLALSLSVSAHAEIVSSSDTHFVLRHEGQSTRSVDEMWQRLTEPATWWHPDHTFSGDAKNLSLEPHAGGLWSEKWEGGSVAHGRVLTVQAGKLLRMDAPFGPLQQLGAYTVWTITLSAADTGGTVVVFDEVSSAPPDTKMDEIAQAVDFVKTEAMSRLIAP